MKHFCTYVQVLFCARCCTMCHDVPHYDWSMSTGTCELCSGSKCWTYIQHADPSLETLLHCSPTPVKLYT